jgi:hypothetical protein
LDYKKAVGDVLSMMEWGILFPIVWPIKSYIRKRKQKKAEKTLELNETPSAVENTKGLH